MKALAIFSIACALPVLAAPPVKPAKSRYAPLWVNSPFTVKPIISGPTGPPPVNPMDDYALGGVTKFPDGYFVILINKKNPTEKITIQPGVQNDFKVMDVTMGTETISPEGKLVLNGASVKLANGSMQGEVKFDDKIMAMKGPSAVPLNPNINNSGARPVLPPAMNNNPNAGGIRQARLRTIPPPVPVNQPQIPQPNYAQPAAPQGAAALTFNVPPTQ